MEKVLLLAFQFPPARSNEVRRVQKVSKYLTRNGVHVDVIASANPGAPMDDLVRLDDIECENLNIERIEHANHKPKSKLGKIISVLFRTDWHFSYTIKLALLLWKMRKTLNQYSYIYCTIRPYSMLFLPKFIKLINKNAKIMLDFRFLFYMESYYYKSVGKLNWIYRYFDKGLLRSALANSDYKICLTDSLGEILNKETGKHFFTIEQGFDSEDKQIVLNAEDKVDFYVNGKINIVYTGSITYTQADPIEMAEVILAMLAANENLVFHFFGLVSGLQIRLKDNDRVRYYSYLNYRQFVYVGETADILWMYYSNNKKNDFRVGTKTYDYMNFSKPILCFCSKNQETVRVLSKYKKKYMIHDHYQEEAQLIDFDALKSSVDIEEANYSDIYNLYSPLIEPSKQIK